MIRKAFLAAFPYTLPIFAGFWFLAFAYGMLMHSEGFSFWYPMLMAMTIFGGSLEFVAVSMLLAPFAPLQTFIIALLIQARHLFYGIALLDRFKGIGWKKPLLIFFLCDETFSLEYTTEPPPDVDRGWFMLWISFLDYLYWVSGAAMGGLLGSWLRFNTKGLSFVMTAMFAVIFWEQFKKEKTPLPAVVGAVSSLGCLLVFGSNNFMIPAMVCMLGALLLLRKRLEKKVLS